MLGISSLNFHRTMSTVVIFLSLMSLAACQTPGSIMNSGPEKAAVPDEARLRARLTEFHNALGANDISKRYAMATTGIREKVTFEEFKKDLRRDENAARRKETRMSAALVRACSCTPMKALRCVLIVDVTIEEAGGKVITDMPLEMWEYDGGEWYWGYIGANSRGRCPGER
jgi:hypothetical protein